jgi:capsular exopolysaccharide synthesis family protein
MAKESKITIDDLEELLEEEHKSRPRFRIQKIYSIFVLNWYYFLISLFIFICGAQIYLRYTEPVYQMSARIMIKSEGGYKYKNASSSQMLSGVVDNSIGLANEMEVLRSRMLLRDVVKELKLYIEYRSEGRVLDQIIYGSQPVNVDLDPAHLDSLDKALIEGGRVCNINMQLTRTDNYYVAQGFVNNGIGSVPFARKTATLPASFKTSIGTVTLTNGYQSGMKVGETFNVMIVPPIQAAARYLGAMSVTNTRGTDIAKLTLTDKNIRRGMDFLRHLPDCYNRQANADKNEIALRTEEFINARMKKIGEELGVTEKSIETFKRQNSMMNVSDASQSVNRSSQLSDQLIEASSHLKLLDDLRSFVSNPENKNQIIPTTTGISDGVATGLIANYNKAVQDRNRLLMAASEEAPQVKTLTATIEELQSNIQSALQQARRNADINRQSLQALLAKHKGRVSVAPVQERVLNQIGRQQDVHSSLFLLLLQKREENSIALAATADKGKLIDEPLFLGQVSPQSNSILMMAAAIGLLLPFGVLFILNFFHYKIEGHDDVMDKTNLPIIADVAMANESAKSSAGIVVHANKNTQMDEIFRSLRTNIQFMLKENENVIMFTSTTSGEGKTFISANIAVSFALLGKKVVLCGLDVRKPALGRLFGISNHKQGITSLLTHNTVSLQDIKSQILPSGVNDNLDLLLAGPVPPNPTELLARETFGQIIAMLRQTYDYVIFDTAPVGLVTDTLEIARHANVSVVICRADYTPKSSFDIINALVKDKKLPNSCVVLNGIDMSRRKYGYYYGYGRYGKYGRYGYSRYGYGHYGSYGQYGRYAESHYGDKNDDSVKK